MYKQNKRLVELIRPVVEALDYELLGIEHLKQGRFSVVRIYIDHEGGIGLDDCEKVSHQVTGTLDVEDPIKGPYTLEVSSPGLDRLLFTLEQFQRHLGEAVKLTLGSKIDGRRRISGRLNEVGDDFVLVEAEGSEVRIPADTIQQARIIPEL